MSAAGPTEPGGEHHHVETQRREKEEGVGGEGGGEEEEEKQDVDEEGETEQERNLKKVLLDRYSWLATRGAGARATVFAESLPDFTQAEKRQEASSSSSRSTVISPTESGSPSSTLTPSAAAPLLSPASGASLPAGNADANAATLVECVCLITVDFGLKKPILTQMWPPLPPAEQPRSKLQKERADYMQSVPLFCFPCIGDSMEKLTAQKHQEFMFVLTDEVGGQKWGYCRRVDNFKGPTTAFVREGQTGASSVQSQPHASVSAWTLAPTTSPTINDSSIVTSQSVPGSANAGNAGGGAGVMTSVATGAEPACLCVITRYPWAQVWRSVLESMERALLPRANDIAGVSDGSVRIGAFTDAILQRDQIPSPHSSFRIACENICALTFTAPSANEILFQSNFRTFFSALPADEIVDVFEAFLLERRVVVCSSNLTLVSDTVHALLALLHPFSWPNIFIPVLPEALLDYCMSPVPFLVGIENSMKSRLASLPTEAGVVFIDLDEGFANVPRDDSPYYTEHAETNLLEPELRTKHDGTPDNFPQRKALLRIVSHAKRGNYDSRAIIGGFHAWKCSVFERYSMLIKSHVDVDGEKTFTFDVDAWVARSKDDRQSNYLFMCEFVQTQVCQQFVQEAEEHPSAPYFEFDKFAAAMAEAKRERRQQQKEAFQSLKRTTSKQLVRTGAKTRSAVAGAYGTLRKARERKKEESKRKQDIGAAKLETTGVQVPGAVSRSRSNSEEMSRDVSSLDLASSPSSSRVLSGADSTAAAISPTPSSSELSKHDSFEDLDMLESTLRSMDLSGAAGSTESARQRAILEVSAPNSETGSPGQSRPKKGGAAEQSQKKRLILGAKKIYANLDSKKQELKERLEHKRRFQASLKLQSWRMATFLDPQTRLSHETTRSLGLETSDIATLLPSAEFYEGFGSTITFPPLDKMVAAGLYFCPTSEVRDRCACFSCGAKLFRWDANDDPLVEHTRTRPNCAVVLASVGTDIDTSASGGSFLVSPSAADTVRAVPEKTSVPAKAATTCSAVAPQHAAQNSSRKQPPQLPPRDLNAIAAPLHEAPRLPAVSTPASSSPAPSVLSPPPPSLSTSSSAPAQSASSSAGRTSQPNLEDLIVLDRRVAVLERQKREFIEIEDYMAAQTVKVELDTVKLDVRDMLRSLRMHADNLQLRIRTLKTEMQQLLDAEDYEGCQRLKSEISEIAATVASIEFEVTGR